MLTRMSLWGALAGLVSGVVLALFKDQIVLPLAGLVFAMFVGLPVWFWAKRSFPSEALVWRSASAFLLLAFLAPAAGIGATVAVDRMTRPNPSSTLLLAESLIPTSLWAIALAISLKLVAGKWDWNFVWQMIVGGAWVWALALASQRHGVEFPFPWLISGLLVFPDS